LESHIIMRKTIHAALALGLLGILVVPLAGCDKPGPAERAGANVDKAAQKVQDAVNPPKGPAEKAGRDLDRATQ
jgi:hypothetical protein